MSDVLIFILVVFLGLIPFGTIVVWTLYRKTVVFQMAMLVFIASMFCSIVAFMVSEYGFMSLYWAIPVCLFFLLSTNFFIKKLIRKPLRELRSLLENLSNGVIDKEVSRTITKVNNEVGEIGESLDKVLKALHQTAKFADEIANSNLDIDYKLLSKDDKLGNSLINMRESLKKAKLLEQEQKQKEVQSNWINTGMARFSEILRSENSNMKKMSEKFITELVNYLGANQGGIFILNDRFEGDETFDLTGCIAFDRLKMQEKRFRLGEGLVGRCAFEKKQIYLREIPETYITITSGLGTANPRNLILIPAILNDEVFAVIELASFTIFEEYQIEFLERVGESLGSTISSIKINEQTQRLLDETHKQAQELAAQEEELRQNIEELQATQEEMRRKNQLV